MALEGNIEPHGSSGFCVAAAAGACLLAGKLLKKSSCVSFMKAFDDSDDGNAFSVALLDVVTGAANGSLVTANGSAAAAAGSFLMLSDVLEPPLLPAEAED